MTASVYKPIDFTGLSRTVDRKMFCRPGIQRVKRALFEVDHEATQKFIQDEFDKITVNDSERWNFDFKREKTLNPNGNFVWHPVAPQRNTQPIKRSFSPSEFIEELYGEPEHIRRPKALRPNHNNEDSNKNKILTASHQKSIKDYMSVKRQTTSETKKPSNWNPDRPSKIRKLAESSS